MPYIC